jgi:hypothetical protein
MAPSSSPQYHVVVDNDVPARTRDGLTLYWWDINLEQQ